MTLNHEYKLMDRAIDRAEAWKMAQYRALCTQAARDQLAEQAAGDLEGTARTYFVYGFTGWSIKQVNPRKAGMEAEFRAGVTARKTMQAEINRVAERLIDEAPHGWRQF